LKFLLVSTMLIASVFMATSALATPMIQEALNPPEILGFTIAPVGMTEFTYEASGAVVPFVNRLSHLNTYILNSNKTGLYSSYTTAGFWNEIQGVETLLKFPNLNEIANRDQVELNNFMEVETVPKFPYLIPKNS